MRSRELKLLRDWMRVPALVPDIRNLEARCRSGSQGSISHNRNVEEMYVLRGVLPLLVRCRTRACIQKRNHGYAHDQDQDAEYDRCKSSTPTCPIGSSIFNPPDHSESSKERKAWEDKTAETARHSTQAKPGVNAQASHPQLKEEGSQDKPVNTRANALVNAVHSAVLSCGRAQQVTIDRDFQGSDGKPTMLISAEVEDGLHASSRSYDVVHVAKQALDAAVAQTKTVKFVSARVQKEDSSYSLRSSIACVPEGVQDRLCWDMFQKGYCNRGMQCRWTHLKNTQCDIVRVKVSVKRAGETSDISSEEQFGFKSSTSRTARSSHRCM